MSEIGPRTSRVPVWPALAAVLLAALPAVRAQERPLNSRAACGTADLISSLRLLSPLPGAAAVRTRPVLAEEQIRAFGDGRFLLHYSLRSVRPAGRGVSEAPDMVEQTARLLLDARRMLVEQGKWPDPQHGKPMDVYLLNSSVAGGSRVVPEIDPALSAEEGGDVFMVLAGPPRRWPTQVLHQYLHAVQLGISLREPVWLYEASALLLEERLGGAAVPADLVVRRLAEPERSLAAEDPRLAGGAAVFLAQVVEIWGEETLRLTWELAGRTFGENAVVALDSALRLTDAATLADAMRSWSVANAYPVPEARPTGTYASLATPVPVARRARDITSASDTEGLTRPLVVDPLGAAYVRLSIPALAGGVRVEIEAEADAVISADLLVSSRQAAGGWMAVPFRLAEGRGSVALPLEPGTEAVVILRNDAWPGAAPRRIGLAVVPEPGAPFELSYLSADPTSGRVEVTWGSESESGLFGWMVYRATDVAGPWQPVTRFPLPAMGDSESPLSYQFVDADLEPGTLYYYVLEGITEDGLARRTAAVAARVPAAD